MPASKVVEVTRFTHSRSFTFTIPVACSGRAKHQDTDTTTMVKRGHIKRAPRQAGSKASDRATNPFGDDDLDKFHKSKDKLALNPEQDSDPGEDILGSEDEGVLDIEDPSDDELDSEADVEDGDLEEGDKKLAACESFGHPVCRPRDTAHSYAVVALQYFHTLRCKLAAGTADQPLAALRKTPTA